MDLNSITEGGWVIYHAAYADRRSDLGGPYRAACVVQRNEKSVTIEDARDEHWSRQMGLRVANYNIVAFCATETEARMRVKLLGQIEQEYFDARAALMPTFRDRVRAALGHPLTGE